jgi:general stress protein 26
MSQIEFSYDECKQEMIEELKKHEWGFLATSKDNHVRVGLMRLVSDGLTLWCWTDRRSRKYKQIKANPNVGIADRNIQIEGIATLKGHPLDDENAAYIKAYRENQPENFEITSKRVFLRSRPNKMVIEIAPKRITLTKLGATPSENILLILDTVRKEAHRLVGTDTFFEAPAYQEYT